MSFKSAVRDVKQRFLTCVLTYGVGVYFNCLKRDNLKNITFLLHKHILLK